MFYPVMVLTAGLISALYIVLLLVESKKHKSAPKSKKRQLVEHLKFLYDNDLSSLKHSPENLLKLANKLSLSVPDLCILLFVLEENFVVYRKPEGSGYTYIPTSRKERISKNSFKRPTSGIALDKLQEVEWVLISRDTASDKKSNKLVEYYYSYPHNLLKIEETISVGNKEFSVKTRILRR